MIENEAVLTFLALHEEGGIGAAAARLHLSQPAVSRRLQGLEADVGAPLFERTRRGLSLTSVGATLLPYAERVRAAERDAAQAVADHVGDTSGPVRIGVVGSLAGVWFTAALTALRAAHPGVELVLSTGTSRQIAAQVARGEVIAGVGYARPRDNALRVRRLFDESLTLVCHPAHPAAGRGLRDLDDLEGERWLLFPERADHPEGSDAAARRLLRRHRVPEERILPIDSLSAQRALAIAGYGLAFLPPEAAADAVRTGQLATIALDDPVGAPVYLMTRREAYFAPAARAAIDVLAATAPA